jgi:hypothetical protein
VANTLKTLGQLYPSSAVLSTLYTAPALTSAVCSSIVICNISATQTTFRIAVRPGGATISNEMYLYYDLPLAGNDTFIATIGISLEAGDVISVYSTLGTLSYNAFGQETT